MATTRQGARQGQASGGAPPEGRPPGCVISAEQLCAPGGDFHNRTVGSASSHLLRSVNKLRNRLHLARLPLGPPKPRPASIAVQDRPTGLMETLVMVENLRPCQLQPANLISDPRTSAADIATFNQNVPNGRGRHEGQGVVCARGSVCHHTEKGPGKRLRGAASPWGPDASGATRFGAKIGTIGGGHNGERGKEPRLI